MWLLELSVPPPPRGWEHNASCEPGPAPSKRTSLPTQGLSWLSPPAGLVSALEERASTALSNLSNLAQSRLEVGWIEVRFEPWPPSW